MESSELEEDEISIFSTSSVILTALLGATVLLILYIARLFSEAKTVQSERVTSEKAPEAVVGDAPAKSKKKQHQERRGRDPKTTFSHPWLLSTLKGHGGHVLDMDFSSNGKYLVSCADDRSVFVWYCKDFSDKEHKSVRTNVEFDYATSIRWSPDTKAFVVTKSVENVVEVYKIGRKNDGSLGNVSKALTFPKKHSFPIVGLGMSLSGRFIMTCSDRTELIVWDLHGETLDVIDTHQANTYHACVTPCGRFVATSGFTPDVKVWEVVFSKAGSFEKVRRAFELKGHTAGIFSFAANVDSSLMVSVSKDGTWRLYDTNIEFDKGQEPYLLRSGRYPQGSPAIVAIAPDSRTIALATGSNVYMYSAVTGGEEGILEDVHSGPVVKVLFDPTSRLLLTAGDKHIRVFHNVAGYRTALQDLEQKRKKAANSAMVERIDRQMAEASTALRNILKETGAQ